MMRLHIVMGLVFTALLLAACGSKESADSKTLNAAPDVRQTASGISGTFVGKIDGSDALIAIVVLETRETLAYVCDSKLVAQWFRGNATADGLALSAGGSKLEARLSIDGAAGQVTLGSGSARSFTATPAIGSAGLYRATKTEASFDLAGGWIVLASGEQRGAVTAVTSPTIGTPISQDAALSGPTTAFRGPAVVIGNPVLPVADLGTGKELEDLDSLANADATMYADSKKLFQTALAVLREHETRVAQVVGRISDSTATATVTPSPGATIKPIVVATALALQPRKLSSAGTSAGLK